jgi:outer membrane protein OmpA-like peptidoglycan-associated protein
MGYLHKQVVTRNLTKTQLVALLRSEGDTVRAAVPATLAGLIGWFIGTGTSRPVTTTTVRPETVSTVRRDDDSKAAAFPWLRWLLIGLGLLLLFWLLTRACNRNDTETTATTTATEPAVVATDTVASDLDGNELATDDSAGADTDANGPEVRVAVDLPGGRKLTVAENSFNYSLARFLAAKDSKAPKVFTFDNLTFETNSARITAKAQPNVDDLIQIMQAYPSLAIRIEGNTDSTGDDAINDPLSAERAQTVKDALVKAGIPSSRVATRELGDRKPVASNQTEAGRQKNRRIDVVVTKL